MMTLMRHQHKVRPAIQISHGACLTLAMARVLQSARRTLSVDLPGRPLRAPADHAGSMPPGVKRGEMQMAWVIPLLDLGNLAQEDALAAQSVRRARKTRVGGQACHISLAE